jgi:orotate phosphoribosyltransferase
MDRMERGGRDDNLSDKSAVEDFQSQYGIPVLSIANLTDLMQYLRSNDDPALRSHFSAVAAYRERYGV